MVKRRLLNKYSRHTAMLMAAVLACTNAGMAASTAFAQELGAEEGGNESNSEEPSENRGGVETPEILKKVEMREAL